MNKNYKNINFDLNKFFNSLTLKKQYIKQLKNKIFLFNSIKKNNYKILNNTLGYDFKQIKRDNLVMYIIDITFARSNTLLHVMDSIGKLKFFCSAGNLNYKGRRKKARWSVFKGIYRLLVTKLRFLKGKPIALHLKNVGLNKVWIIKKLKKKFFIKVVKIFTLYPHNGCRKRKIRRKKFKKRIKTV